MEEQLIRYSYQKKYEKIKKLINNKRVNINFKDSCGWSALYYCCFDSFDNNLNNLDIVIFLINNGANVNIKNDNNWTPLRRACVNGN